MRNGFLGSLTALLAGTGLALGQSQVPSRLPPVIVPGPMTTFPATTLPGPVVQAPPAGRPAAGQATPLPPATTGQPGRPVPPTTAPTTSPTPMVQGQAVPPGAGGPGCDQKCCCSEPPFCEPGRFYSEAEYLLWWTKGHKVPPLVTTGQPLTLTTTGAIGQPGTLVLFGDEELNESVRSGYRVGAGYWLNPETTVGIEANYFYLEPKSTSFAATSNGSTILARPFTNFELLNRGLTPGLTISPENALLVAFPPIPGFLGTAAGTASASSSNKVWGAEGNARVNVAGCSWYRADMLLGFRYVGVDEDLNVLTTSLPAAGTLTVFRGPTGIGPTVTNAQSVSVLDQFSTTNDFYGGQVGARIELRAGERLSAEFLGKIALGDMHQVVDINGASRLTAPGIAPTTVAGGLLAQSTNIGHHTRDEFGIVPELGVTVGYWVTDRIKGFVGWSIIYWRTDVVRPGQQINPIINPALPPTINTSVPAANPAFPSVNNQPAFQFVDSDFWAQGFNFGIEISF